MKRLLFFVFCFLFFVSPVRADQIEDLNNQIKQYEDKIKELSGQRQTLAATINYLNNQISLTQVRITKTQAELALLEKDIDDLGNRIADLNTSLDDLSQILVRHVRGTYSQSLHNDPVYLFFTSGGFTEFINRYQYLKAVQNNDKKIMKAMETSRQNYNIQKTLKEQKQQEVEKLNSILKQQQTKLTNQQTEKQQLLELTKNDEKKYQALLQEALRQRQAFKRFVTSQGGASILNNQTKCDDWGCYINQRDALWGNQLIGNSYSTTAEYGCFVTSAAMVASFYKKDIKPSDIASNPLAFSLGTLLKHQFSVKDVNFTITKTSMSTETIDDELNAGRPIIAALYGDPPGHFIVIKGKNDKGYIMNDPYTENGGDRPLSDKYSVSDISSLRKIRIN